MLDGSVAISTSIPALSMAARVLARRAAYSARSKAGAVSDTDAVSTRSAGKTLAGALRAGAGEGEIGEGGILHAGAGEVAQRDVVVGAPPRCGAGEHRAELGKVRPRRHHAPFERMMQLAEQARLAQPVRHVDAQMLEHARIDLVLMSGIRPHGGDVLARLAPALHKDRRCGGRRSHHD